jgi:hypothetical protein
MSTDQHQAFILGGFAAAASLAPSRAASALAAAMGLTEDERQAFVSGYVQALLLTQGGRT